MRISVLIVALLGGLIYSDALAGDPVVMIYDVRDLLHPPKDFPAPKLGLSGLEEETGGVFDDEDEDLNGPIITADELVELIETHIQPDRWQQEGNSVRVHNGRLIIVADADTHSKVSKNILAWRSRGVPTSTYSVRTRAYPADAALLKALGFKKKSKRNSHAVEPDVLSAALALVETKPHDLPKLSLIDGQTSHVVHLDQSAYLSDAKLNPETGVVDPQIDVLTEGVTFETTVRRRGRKRMVVTWKAQIAKANASSFEQINGSEIELPEIAITSLHGRSVLKPGRTLAIRGLPHPDHKTEGEYVWLVDITEVPNKKRKAVF